MSAISMARAYVQYWWKAKNAHGVHSPFVFDFYQRVWKGPRATPDEAIEVHRQKALQDASTLQVADFGAGSSITPGTERSVAAIARHSAKSISWVLFLTRLLQQCGYRRVLDLGTSLGFTTAYLARQASVTSVEGCPQVAQKAQSLFRDLQLSVDQHIENLDTWLPTQLPQLPPFDLVWLDANHQFEPTVRYVDLLLNHLPNHGCLVMDDIHWSTGMEKAWNQIIQDPRVTVSLDLFEVGVLFVRPGQAKEHFVLK